MGFRPYVYRLAISMGVVGTVANSSSGVEIRCQGLRVREFISKLKANPPPLARVTSFRVRPAKPRRFKGFRIVASGNNGDMIPHRVPIPGALVLPDIAVCPECRKELLCSKDRRFCYPFTNCTQCGPRYTIVRTLPYDRPRTTLRGFQMCPDCSREYQNPEDRRFHAQPNACPECGPSLSLLDSSGRLLACDPIMESARAIAAGRIVAIKSLGGFQLACDATSTKAVARLRQRKSRPAKPLAVMCENLSAVRGFCRITGTGRELLCSPAAPIVLLRKRYGDTIRNHVPISVSRLIAPNNSHFGVMLAYTPLHVVLLRELHRLQGRAPVLVMTSANTRDDRLTASDPELLQELRGVFDLALTHNRPIANRCDDSVVLADKRPIMVRRARGYAPQPIVLDPWFHVKQPTLALGAELRNCFALADANRVFLSPHIGNLGSSRAEHFFHNTLERYLDWTKLKPCRIACDLHPNYLSTRLAERLSAKWKLPLFRVQHHYAHVAAVMAEHGIQKPALGLAFDGTGYGTDRAIWGCEFLLVGPDLSWRRVGHLKYLQLTEPGAVVANPGRVAAGYLLQVTGRVPRQLGLSRYVGPVRNLLQAHRAVATSSLGRLFDAVAGITGVCRNAAFEGQAPIALEACANPDEQGHYFRDNVLLTHPDPALVDPGPIISQVLEDVLAKTDPAVVSARFHNTIVRAVARLAHQLARSYRVNTVLLSGGSFQNNLLRHRVSAELRRKGYRVVYNQLVPVNDGGISLGQAVSCGTATP